MLEEMAWIIVSTLMGGGGCVELVVRLNLITCL